MELELQAVQSCPIWSLGTKLRLSARAVHAFTCEAISLFLGLFIYACVYKHVYLAHVCVSLHGG